MRSSDLPIYYDHAMYIQDNCYFDEKQRRFYEGTKKQLCKHINRNEIQVNVNGVYQLKY